MVKADNQVADAPAVARAAALLADRFPAGAVRTEPAAIAAAGRLWNGDVHPRPAMLVHCRSSDDVVAAVLAAAEVGLGVSVVGGGHDWNGSAMRDGAMALDLAGLHQVEIRDDGVAVVGGATTISELLDAAGPRGWGAVVGTVGSVGVTGLVMGGGLSQLSGVAGLGVDNLLAAEVVLADGRVVRADSESEPELFWAIRGGGGNFGVVTQLELRLHPIPEVTTGMIAFPWGQARDVLRGWHAVTAVDDGLDVMFGAMVTPGGLVLFTTPLWTGDAATARPHLDRVRALGDPVMDDVARMPLAASVHAMDEICPPGGNYRCDSRTLPADLDDAAIEAFCAAAEIMPPTCFLNVHHLHGAATRPGVADTAYAYRDEHVVVEILASWTGDGQAERGWMARAGDLLDPHALPGGWANLMAQDDPRAQDAYGPNTRRLLAAKRHYDPAGRFAATPLPTLRSGLVPGPRRDW